MFSGRAWVFPACILVGGSSLHAAGGAEGLTSAQIAGVFVLLGSIVVGFVLRRNSLGGPLIVYLAQLLYVLLFVLTDLRAVLPEVPQYGEERETVAQLRTALLVLHGVWVVEIVAAAAAFISRRWGLLRVLRLAIAARLGAVVWLVYLLVDAGFPLELTLLVEPGWPALWLLYFMNAGRVREYFGSPDWVPLFESTTTEG